MTYNNFLYFTLLLDIQNRIQAERETYIATLSHDLKIPTIAQVRALELILSGKLGDLNNEQQELLKLTLDSCNYMYNMVHTLLSSCKFESGEVALNYNSFNIIKLITECIQEINSKIEDNSILIEFMPEIENFTIEADRYEIKRAIINILSNSINYAYPSSIIKVKFIQNYNNIELHITNSGSYINKGTMHKLFKKYSTHSEKFNKVGTGLGLYLSKQIIEAHNGSIIAQSRKDNQNTFGFILPINNTNNADILKLVLKVS